MRVKANEIKEHCKKMVYDRINDSNADYSDGILEKILMNTLNYIRNTLNILN